MNPWHLPKFQFRDDILDREDYLSQLLVKNSFVKILVGPRRVGKSSIVYSFIRHFCKRNANKRILFLNGDLIADYSLIDFVDRYCDANRIERKKLVLVVDEVQEIEDWASQVKILYDLYRMQVIVTGSSSSAISEKMSKLSGRHSVIRVMSLSFQEYIYFSSQQKKQLSPTHVLEKYLEYGGYPEQFSREEIIPLEYLRNALESSLYRDLTRVYGISNPQYLLKILEVFADNMTNPSSYNNISRRIGISDDTVKTYIEYLQSTLLVFKTLRYGNSNKIAKGSIPKYYFSDIGLLNVLGAQAHVGHKIENLVFLQLLRKNSFSLVNPITYFMLGKKEVEVDFCVDGDLYEVKDTLNQEAAVKIQLLAETTSTKISIIARKFEAIPRSNYIENIELIDFLDVT